MTCLDQHFDTLGAILQLYMPSSLAFPSTLDAPGSIVKGRPSLAVGRLDLDAQVNEVLGDLHIVKVACFGQRSAVEFALDLWVCSVLIKIVNDR